MRFELGEQRTNAEFQANKAELARVRRELEEKKKKIAQQKEFIDDFNKRMLQYEKNNFENQEGLKIKEL